jgi:hypothetical protein
MLCWCQKSKQLNHHIWQAIQSLLYEIVRTFFRYNADVYICVPSRLFHRTCDWIGGHVPTNSVKFGSKHKNYFFSPRLLRKALDILLAEIPMGSAICQLSGRMSIRNARTTLEYPSHILGNFVVVVHTPCRIRGG